MPTTYTSGRHGLVATARDLVARFGIKAGIIALGGAIAVGTLHTTTYLPHTSVGAAVVANNPADSATLVAKLSKAFAQPAAAVASAPNSSSGLDLGASQNRVGYWVSKLSSTGSGFATTLGRMEKYASMITAKLAAKDMPKDLIYLAAIESEFNPNAKSPVKAVGLWQFMSGTARRFGLKVGGRVDERRDPARATDAALDYLSALHDRFGSWYLAAAAYNSGEGTVLHALRRVTGRDTGTDADFFTILPDLPKETQDYVPKLIAAAKIGNSPDSYGVTPAATPLVEVKNVTHPAARSGRVVKARAVSSARVRARTRKPPHKQVKRKHR